MQIGKPSIIDKVSRSQTVQSFLKAYWIVFAAYAALTGLCLWATFRNHFLWVAGRVLGEHWYSIYNCMLAVGAALIFAASKKKQNPALAWKVWDLTICCAFISLGGKLIPLRRPSGGMHGFPSGHALTAFAASCLLMNTFPKIAPYVFAIAVAVGWSRVEIHEHFTYQVLFGAAMGIIVGVAVSHARENEGVIVPRFIRRRSKIAHAEQILIEPDTETKPSVTLLK